MKKIIKRIRIMLKLFSSIEIGVSFAAAIYITVFWGWDADISVSLIWQILAVSFLCSFTGLLFPTTDEKELSKKSMLLRTILCFVFVNGIVLVSGFLFEWFQADSPLMVVGMEICIIAVFTVIMAGEYYSSYLEVQKINRRLSETRKDQI